MSRVILMMKNFEGNLRKTTLLKIGIIVILVAGLLISMAFTSYSDNLNKDLADNLIRLHVLANSDSEEDQALKRDVRDVILKYMREQLKSSADIEQTKFIINRDMNKIEEIALDEIKRQGKDYSVKATLGSYPFPTKNYGDVTLPSGFYQALRVVIGKGEGANWWCVLFPPLCFVDATHGTIPDSVKENLKNVLTEEEYGIVTSTDSEDVPIKIKFKIFEFFQGSKVKFSGMVKRFFKS